MTRKQEPTAYERLTEQAELVDEVTDRVAEFEEWLDETLTRQREALDLALGSLDRLMIESEDG